MPLGRARHELRLTDSIFVHLRSTFFKGSKDTDEPQRLSVLKQTDRL